MKKLQNKYLLISLYTLTTIAASALVIYFIFNFTLVSSSLGKLFGVLSPIFWGFVIAYLINPLVRFFEKKVFAFKKAKKDRPRLKRVLSVICAYIVVLALLSALLWVIIPQFTSSFNTFKDAIPGYARSLESWANSLLHEESRFYPIAKKVVDSFNEFVDGIVEYVTELLPKAVILIKDISVFIINVIVAVFVSIYMISRKENLAAQLKKLVCALFKEKWVNRLSEFSCMLDSSVGGFIKGKIIDSAIIGVLCYIVMIIFRLDYALLISVIVGVTNVIPFFGPFIGAIPSAFILLMVDPHDVIPFVIAILLIQQLDGNYIGPKILGDSLGLSPFWVLVSIVVMSGLFGFAGMVIGVPIFSVVYVLVERLIDRRLEAKQMPTDVEAYHTKLYDCDHE